MTAPYTTGTVSVSANGTAVTGSGTAFVIQGIKAGDLFTAGGLSVPVASVESNTGLTLAASWPGSTLSGSAYAIVQVADAGALALVNNQRLAEIAARLGAEFYINIYGADNAATGLLADRSTHDAKPRGFAYFATDTFEVYAKLSNTSADWSAAVSMRGPSGGQGVAGARGATGGAWPFAFSTTVDMADPGTGAFRVNNSTPALATSLAISNTQNGGGDVSDALVAVMGSTSTVKARVVITTATARLEFDATAITDNGAWLEVTLANGVAVTGSLANGAVCEIALSRTGQKGDTGPQGPFPSIAALSEA
jgi:hypothetical protein